MHKKTTIYYVIDNRGWIEHHRFRSLRRYIDSYKPRLLTLREFKTLWRFGFLRKRPVFFSTWRIAHALIKARPDIFSEDDFKYFMAAVTSHSNIGGGLDPLNPIPGRTQEEAFELAVSLLKRFKVITVNSMILYEMLKNALPNILYCPNGVDADFFTPDKKKQYNPNSIRIGWVGKIRGPKNFEVIKEAFKRLKSLGNFKPKIIMVPKQFRKAPLSQKEMRDFYKNIDFYLCASLNEGTPNPALEAGSCGVPIVTTRVGNMRELIKISENGFFVEPTVDSIVSRFEEIGRMDTKNYKRLSINMRDSIVKDWSWDKNAKNFISAFEKLINN